MMSSFESLNFDNVENQLYDMIQENRTRRQHMNHRALRWIVTTLVAALTGSIAVLVHMGAHGALHFKYYVTNMLLLDDSEGALVPFAFFLSVNLIYALIAAACVFVEPQAKGSGIPEIKSYLNGNDIPRVVHSRTLLSKAVGVVFSIAGGLPVGKEGPMIHSGAIVAANLTQNTFLTRFFPFLLEFSNDKDKRLFVSVGAACGVAAAFSAPVGAVLFALEEACSFWSVSLMWMMFFGTMSTTCMTNFFLSGIAENQWGQMSSEGLVHFGSFEGPSKPEEYNEQPGYTFQEIPWFVLLGAIGGLLGASFNALNTKLSLWRRKHVTTPQRRLIEVVMVTFICSCIVFSASYYGRCVEVSDRKENVSMVHFHCKEGRENELATLFYHPQDEAIRHLLHNVVDFDWSTLVVFAISFFYMANLTYGISIPSGLFVPTLLFGSVYGRLMGQFLHNTYGYPYDPGSFALVGAASFLGGVSRMTISIVVIIVETTNDVSYAVPVMIAVMIAKLVGDSFNNGLYHIHIHLKGVPYLEDDSSLEMRRMRASDVMKRKVKTLREVVQVEEVVNLLRSCTHNGFPVVRPRIHGEDEVYCGMILRFQLTVLLQEKTFSSFNATLIDVDKLYQPLPGSPRPSVAPSPVQARRNSPILEEASTSPSSPTGRRPRPSVLVANAFAVGKKRTSWHERNNVLHWSDFNQYYPNYPDIDEMEFTETELGMFIDLTPYLNPSASTTHHSTHLSRVHRLFRMMSLRHLPVVNTLGHVVGMITRNELQRDLVHVRAQALEKLHGSKTLRPQFTQRFFQDNTGFSKLTKKLGTSFEGRFRRRSTTNLDVTRDQLVELQRSAALEIQV